MEPFHPKDVIKDDPELRWLNSTCLPSWKTRSKERHVARPERPEYAIALGLPPNAKWASVLMQLQEGMRRNEAGRMTLEAAKATESAQASHKRFSRTVKWPRDNSWIAECPNFFPVIAAILYAQETDRPAAAKKPTSQIIGCGASMNENLKLGVKLKPQFKRLFFEMLQVDYGSSSMGAQKIQQRDPRAYGDLLRFAGSVISYANNFVNAWDDIDTAEDATPEAVTYISTACTDFDPSDFATMLYYFYHHHRMLDGDKVEYTGVMQTLIGDVPRTGNNERLHRKLSVDYNVLTSHVCDSPSDEWPIQYTIRAYKEWHRLSLSIPKDATRVEPYGRSKKDFRDSCNKWVVVIILNIVLHFVGHWLLPSLTQRKWLWYITFFICSGAIQASVDSIWDA
ncbi:hypothetical protein PG984_005054 [Apiospora sp. TS-2023a]